jgi:hypothetical protein
LDIRSRVGAGTCVSVRLPIDCERVRVVETAPNVQRLPIAEPAVLPTDIRMRKSA